MSGMTIVTGTTGIGHKQNINNINVPEHLRRRIPFGVDWVDDIFGGIGVPPSMSILLTGTPGAGKTTLCLQLADAVMRQPNAMALFNSKEESLYQVKLTVERLGLKDGFICGEDELIDTKGIPAGAHKHWEGHASVLDHAREMIDDNPGKDLFVFVDSLQTMNDGKYGPGNIIGQTQMRVIEQLTSFAKTGYHGTWPVICVVGQVTKSGEFAGKNGIKHATDAHFHIYIDEDKKSDTWGERIAENQKNRFGCTGKKMILGMDKTGLYKKGEYSFE